MATTANELVTGRGQAADEFRNLSIRFRRFCCNTKSIRRGSKTSMGQLLSQSSNGQAQL